MNEKFFDLKKEKQDRMINAGLKIFALNGYHHASTDDIVREAGISKGLLFHYFGSKSGYYAFLYDYTTRYAILELTSGLRGEITDYFDLQQELVRIEAQLMQQYPFLFLYQESVLSDQDPEARKSIETPERTVAGYYRSVLSGGSLSNYLRISSEEDLSSMIHFVKIGIMRQYLPQKGADTQFYLDRAGRAVRLLRHLSSNL